MKPILAAKLPHAGQSRSLVILVGAVGLVASSLTAEDLDAALKALEKTSKAFTYVAKKATPAVVFVTAERTVESSPRQMPFQHGNPHEFFNDEFFERFFRRQFPQPRSPRSNPRQRPQTGQGSGFIVSKDGYILTNNHVVGAADKIKVKLQNGREFLAKKIGTDPQSDVAVVKIEGDDFPFLPVGDSDKLEVGEWVIAIGNPFGLAQTVTVGVVSAKGRSRVGLADYEDFIQTDAAINPGNSGGPLINLRGQAVGMNTAIFSRSGGYMGIGFAIPINMAESIREQLVKTGKVTRGFLGISMQDLTEELSESLGATAGSGVLVAEVLPGSAAEKAGIKEGDIITKMGGRPVEDMGKFRNRVSLVAPGTEVTFTILRDGKEVDLKANLGNRTDFDGVAAASGQAQALGLRVQELTKELAEELGYEVGEGVIVSEVMPGSPAANAGLQSGALITSVNRKPVKSVADFDSALAGSARTKRALLLAKQGGRSMFLVLKWE